MDEPVNRDRESVRADAVGRIRAHSPFLSSILDRHPGWHDAVRQGALDWRDPQVVAPDMPVARRLRWQRNALALAVAVDDLAGLADLTEVTQRLSEFADHALDTAIAAAIAERVPDAPPHGFVAIALGKHGSRELNYSSDVDPILLFDPTAIPRRARDEPEEAAVRIARRVVDLLQTRDGDGYVLRVDLRLRPAAEVTPIAIPLLGAISHYESQALTWERAAFIRARAAAGDLALGRQFLEAIRPFVWRRGLDFGAVREIRELSRRIRDHYASGQAFGPGYDLKRGRGGIREIEFFAQIHQLIHGGRDPALRVPATRNALAALAVAGHVTPEDAAMLTDAYVRLRTVEHRLQMVDDRQTHSLPAGSALEGVAALDGLPGADALLAGLHPSITAVGRLYDTLDDSRPAQLPHTAEALAATLDQAGFADGAAAAAAVAGWRGGRYPALRSPAAREALEAVLPVLMPALAEAPDPAAALRRLDRMLERLSSAINIFRLLEARPGLAAMLAAILSHAPPLADALAMRPELIDGLIDASAFEPLGEVDTLVAAMRRGDAADYQSLLDQVRRIVGERRFALGCQIVAGAADPLVVAGGYARLAEAAVETLAAATIADFARTHGRVPDSELVILGYGRLGGRALTHASDLDLVYLFTGDYAAESDGAKPLGATLYYNRLAQRIGAALSVPTAAGPLYPVDTRLRPSGTQGPLVVSLDSFARYQREGAWTWEHMALTRARPVFGSPAARAAVQQEIDAVLGGARAARDIAADAEAMRGEMARHKPPAGPLDVKLLPGGLVDLEFTVHVAQLRYRAGFDPQLLGAIDTLIALGRLPASLGPAYAVLARLLVVVRLVAPDAAEPPPATCALIARALGMADWPEVLATLAATRQDVAAAWAATTEDDDG